MFRDNPIARYVYVLVFHLVVSGAGAFALNTWLPDFFPAPVAVSATVVSVVLGIVWFWRDQRRVVSKDPWVARTVDEIMRLPKEDRAKLRVIVEEILSR